MRVLAAAAGISVGLGPVAIMSAAAQNAAAGPGVAGAVVTASTCLAPGYVHCLRYSFTGDDQFFTVPGAVSEIRVLEWGAGGGGASSANGQYSAGAGGYTAGDVAVQPGQQLTVTVGQGGFASGTGYDTYGYGGGGLGGNGREIGAGGGGLSAVWDGSYGVAPLLIAGGGGGASPGSPHGADGTYSAVIGGGAGGGLNGGSDGTQYSGSGGTQLYGGTAGSPPSPCLNSGIGGTAPGDGQQYQGGPGGGSDPSPPGLGTIAEGGGGGGGGYWGGGGGRCQVSNTDMPNGAGGGGSGYISGAGVSHALTVPGTNALAAGLNSGAPPALLARINALYRPGLGWGGGRSGAAAGGNGQVVIEWDPRRAPTPSPAPTVTPTPSPSVSAPAPAPPDGPQPPSGPLPVTGFPFAPAGIAGLGLIAVGAGLTWAGARRRGRSREA